LTYAKGGKDIAIPHPRAASLFLARLHQVEQERETHGQVVRTSQQKLDELILDMYSITQPAWRDSIYKGVPWARS
jgi:hypothetical protein